MKSIFYQRLKELRKINNKSQAELAKILDTTQSTIGKYERGELEPSLNMLIKICLYFRETSDYLLGLEDETGGKYINSFNNFNFNGHDMNIK